MNIGRFVTAAGVLMGGQLFAWFGDSYSSVGPAFAMVFAVGAAVILFAPDTEGRKL
jgi:hypothetical protein